ncbi:acyl-CoA dehydrogenase family protein [Actinocorallia sp. A-T 12471]|uniref:acyl-CoA dehydrogenase family protein n=1 Tax=Actinocorallia sp. A-T 12471 TaxID=3089813 RepID=UPI0029D151AA|nr:acyl-CoA dehydrogenase family protein [Actinocorallia sp. A-T 12471]MDX6740978.1 acyl-CoA dehydrogenase family protein [Actinocorallia sp. A-T 12471]
MGDDDLGLLRESLRAAFADLSPSATVRAHMASARGWSPKEWRRLSRELGLAGFLVPEEYGGGGFTAVEAGVVFEEAGRALLCAPLFAVSALAVPLLLALDDPEAAKRYLPGLAAGTFVATVATADVHGRPLPDGVMPEASEGPDGPTVTGSAGFVVDGASADVIFVPARTADGIGVFAVESRADGVTATPLTSLDLTRKLARLDFADAPAARIGRGDATAPLTLALDVARALLAAEQAGGAARCLELTVAHGKTRVQFGRPIGSFQAFKQKCADLLVKTESARSAAEAAAQAAALGLDGDAFVRLPGLPELPVVVSVAASYCAEAYVAVTAEMIQLHGGIGFTWEHDAHLYYKRAWTGRELLGRPEEHTERLAGLLAAR